MASSAAIRRVAKGIKGLASTHYSKNVLVLFNQRLIKNLF